MKSTKVQALGELVPLILTDCAINHAFTCGLTLVARGQSDTGWESSR